jgi:hypothetical protein
MSSFSYFEVDNIPTGTLPCHGFNHSYSKCENCQIKQRTTELETFYKNVVKINSSQQNTVHHDLLAGKCNGIKSTYTQGRPEEGRMSAGAVTVDRISEQKSTYSSLNDNKSQSSSLFKPSTANMEWPSEIINSRRYADSINRSNLSLPAMKETPCSSASYPVRNNMTSVVNLDKKRVLPVSPT